MYDIDAKQDIEKDAENALAYENEIKRIDTKKIELLVRIMGSLFRLFYFPKYTITQVSARRALSILNQLIFHIDIINAEMRHNVRFKDKIFRHHNTDNCKVLIS